MRNTADILNPFRQIFYYVQETLQPWFSSSPRTLEIFESKRHRGHASKQVTSDFMPFFFICAFLVVVICLVSKQPKERNDEEEEEEEEEETERISSMPMINETITESSASSVCSVPVDSTDYTSDICPDCDDLSPSTRISQLIPALNFSIRDHTFRSLPDIPDSARSSSYASALSVGNGEKAASTDQQVQKKRSGNQKRLASKAQKRVKHHHQARVCLDREWFVRRTRSGQIYGTYAF